MSNNRLNSNELEVVEVQDNIELVSRFKDNTNEEKRATQRLKKSDTSPQRRSHSRRRHNDRSIYDGAKTVARVDRNRQELVRSDKRILTCSPDRNSASPSKSSCHLIKVVPDQVGHAPVFEQRKLED